MCSIVGIISPSTVHYFMVYFMTATGFLSLTVHVCGDETESGNYLQYLFIMEIIFWVSLRFT